MFTSKRLIFALSGFVLCLGMAFSAIAQDETLTNTEVIALTKAGLDKSVIAAKVRSARGKFDLSTTALIELKKEGVADEVVAAMLEVNSGAVKKADGGAAGAASGDPNDPMSPHDYGVYLYEDKDGKKVMTQLTANVSAQNRTGGLWTSSITYGIGKVKVKANLPGNSAKLQLKETQPVFYFYLDAKSGGLNTSSGIPSNPNEFALVKFNVRSDNREVTIGKANAFGAKGGLSDEYVVQFNAESQGNGIYKITPLTPLKNGEYGFYLINSGNSNASSAVGSKFFDFGIKVLP